jgi:mono/diheme cytochrome c family protein
MKKLIVLSFICAAGIISCGKKMMPESGTSNQSRSENNKDAKTGTQLATTNTSATTTPSFNNMQQSIPPVQENSRSVSMDNGKTVFVSKCVGCHALKNPGDYTMNQMNIILKTEIPKAKLSSKEADEVTAYLLANSKK